METSYCYLQEEQDSYVTWLNWLVAACCRDDNSNSVNQ